MEDSTICIHCKALVSGQYCSHCGQRLNVKRITFREGWFDFWARIYGFDGMFPRTLRDLTIRPGSAARTFISGDRSSYYGPVGYFFLMITLFLLLLSFLDLDFVDFVKGMQKTFPVAQKENPMQVIVQQFVSDNIKLVAFFVIPFQAFTARYIFFRKSGLNFLENMVLPFFITGHIYWLSMAAAIYYKISGTLLHSGVQILCTVLYFGFSYTSFITYQPKIKTFFKGVGTYLVSQLLMLTTIFLLVMIWVLLLAWFDPDALQLFKPTQG